MQPRIGPDIGPDFGPDFGLTARAFLTKLRASRGLRAALLLRTRDWAKSDTLSSPPKALRHAAKPRRWEAWLFLFTGRSFFPALRRVNPQRPDTARTHAND